MASLFIDITICISVLEINSYVCWGIGETL